MLKRSREIMKERANLVKEIVKAINILKAESEVAEALNISISNTNAASEEEIIRLTEELEAAKRTIEELNRKAKEDEEYINSLRAENERHLNRIFDLTNPAVEDTKEYENVYCGECQEDTKQEILNTKELKCTVCGETWERFTEEEIVETKEEPKPETKKGADKKVTKKQSRQKSFDNKNMTKCGASEGEEEVVFITKDKANDRFYGQIRINNQIRNFWWSCTNRKALVYGIEDLDSLTRATEIIKIAVPKEERNKRDIDDLHPALPQWEGRYYYNKLNDDAFAYVTTDYGYEEATEDSIIFKGYYNKHAFIVRADGEIFWRHYNYVFMKKPFESTPSKGFDAEAMANGVSELVEKAVKHFERSEAVFHAKENKTKSTKDIKNTNDKSMDNSTADSSDMDYSALL